MRSTAVLAGSVAAIMASLPFASANVHPHPTDLARRAAPAVSTSFSEVGTLLFTNGNRFFTTVSVPIIISITDSASPASSTGGGGSGPSSSGGGGGGGGNSSGGSVISTSSDFRNATVTQSGGGGNGTAAASTTSTSTTPTTLPFAPTTVPYGGGGTTIAAPVPGGGGGSIPQGPPDTYHRGAGAKVVASVFGLVLAISSLAAVQSSSLL